MTKIIKSKALISAIFVALLSAFIGAAFVLPTSAESATTDKWENVDFDGTEIIMNLNNWDPTSLANAGATNGIKYIMGPDEYTNDTVQNAVYDRNKKVTSKLGINVKYNQDTYPSVSTLPIIENFVLSDLEGAPDIIQAPGYDMVRAGIKGLLYNALNTYEDNYFDISEENGWYTDFMFENTLDESKIFLLAGDYFIDVLRYTYGVLVNIDMYDELFNSEGGIGSLYEMIADGKWTYDELMRFADAAYLDNGTVGSVDEEDVFGVAASSSYYYRNFFSTSGLDIFEETNGKIAYMRSVPHLNDFVDTLIEMLSHDSFLNPHKHGAGNYEVTTLFTAGKTLFALDQCIATLEGFNIRGMDDGVGILPFPKYDKNESYKALISDMANLGGILYNSDKFTECSALLQMMCEESNGGSGTPMYEYYEVTLKNKYAVNVEQRAMLDIIRNGMCSPKSFLYDNYFAKNAGAKTYGAIMSDSINMGINRFNTVYAMQYTSVQNSLDKTYKVYGVQNVKNVSGSCGTNATYEYFPDTGELKISGSGSIQDYSPASHAPWYVYRSAIKSVTIAEGITSIGNYAFEGCSALTGIEIPSSVTYIGSYVFLDCSALETLAVAEENNIYYSKDNCIIHTLSKSLVVGCKNSIIPTDGSVTLIGSGAFDGCTGLEAITIPSTVTSIDNNAFRNCTSLTSIEVPLSVTFIGSHAFYGCSNLIQTEGGISYVDKWAIACDTSVTSVSVRKDTVGIACDAFQSCSGLTSIELPSSVTDIDSYAFYNCASLTSITLWADKPVTLGSYAFSGTAIERVCVPDPVIDAYRSREDWAEYKDMLYAIPNTELPVASGKCGANATWEFYQKTGELKILGSGGMYNYVSSDMFPSSYRSEIKTITVSDGITGIGHYAFEHCTALTSIVFGENSSLTSIGGYAFAYCKGLENIDIPSSVTAIFDFAFQSCSALTEIELPSSLTKIEIYAFNGCSSLKSIEIPSSVTSIGEGALPCGTLEALSVQEGNTVYHSKDNCIIQTDSKTLIAGCKNSVIPTDGSVTAIGAYAFSGCTELETLTIPSSITGINSRAFSGCSNLIQVENGVSYVDKWVVDCDNLSDGTVSLRENTVGIADYAFSAYINLISIELPSSIAFIGDYAFSSSDVLTEIELPSSLTSVGYHAFSSCRSLTSIEIPSSLTSIGAYAFERCSALEKLTVEEGNPVYHSDNNCIIQTDSKTLAVGCKNSVIPTDGSVTAIGEGAFEGCDGLKSIVIPSCIISIGKRAFGDCESLSSVTFMSETPTALEGDVFIYSKIESISVPESALEAYKSHASWADESEDQDIISLIKAFKYGDTDGNGKIEASDLLMVRRYMANYNYETGTSTFDVKSGADVNGSGKIDVADVLMLRKYMANYDYTTGTSSVVLGPKS